MVGRCETHTYSLSTIHHPCLSHSNKDWSKYILKCIFSPRRKRVETEKPMRVTSQCHCALFFNQCTLLWNLLIHGQLWYTVLVMIYIKAFPRQREDWGWAIIVGYRIICQRRTSWNKEVNNLFRAENGWLGHILKSG